MTITSSFDNSDFDPSEPDDDTFLPNEYRSATQRLSVIGRVSGADHPDYEDAPARKPSTPWLPQVLAGTGAVMGAVGVFALVAVAIPHFFQQPGTTAKVATSPAAKVTPTTINRSKLSAATPKVIANPAPIVEPVVATDPVPTTEAPAPQQSAPPAVTPTTARRSTPTTAPKPVVTAPPVTQAPAPAPTTTPTTARPRPTTTTTIFVGETPTTKPGTHG